MKAQVLTGSRQEIANTIAHIEGDIHEVIVFLRESSGPLTQQPEDIFVEMEAYMVNAGGADYSRQSLYQRMEGE